MNFRSLFLLSSLIVASAQASAQTRTYSTYSPSTISGSSSREYTLGLTGNMSFMNSGGNQSTIFDVSTQFGWNRDTWEAGPKLMIQNRSTAGTNVSLFGIGGYGDYNFKQTSSSALGMTASLLLGNASGAINVGSSPPFTIAASSQFTQFEIGGVFKWFILRSSSTAFRFEMVYQSTSANTAISGLVMRYGLQTYF